MNDEIYVVIVRGKPVQVTEFQARKISRNVALMARKRSFYCECDLCGRRFREAQLQMHEIIHRALTYGEARAISYLPELVSLLCAECHAEAHNAEAAIILLRKNIALFGGKVEQSLMQIDNHYAKFLLEALHDQ